MKTHLILLTLVVISIMTSSCITQQRCNNKFPAKESTSTRDSLVIRDSIAYRDSIIKVFVPVPFLKKRDSVVIVYENGKARNEALILKGTFSEAIVRIKDGKLTGELTETGALALKVKVTSLEKYITTLKTHKSDSVKVVPQRYIPKWVKTLAWVGAISILLVALYIILRIYSLGFKPP